MVRICFGKTLQDQALTVLSQWTGAQGVRGLELEVVRVDERTPLLFIDIAASDGCADSPTVLLYGHGDKQPPLAECWDADLGPCINFRMCGIQLKYVFLTVYFFCILR